MFNSFRRPGPLCLLKPVTLAILGIGAVSLIVSPAHAGMDVVQLAQVVDTDSMSSRSVGDVIETMRQWKLITLIVSMILVIALLFAGGLLRPGGYAKAGLRDVSMMPAVVWLFAAFVVMLAASSAQPLITKSGWFQEPEYTAQQIGTINQLTSYVFAIIAGLGMLFVLKRSTMSDGECKAGLGLSLLDLPVGLGCFFLAYPFIELMNMLGVFLYEQTQGAAPHGMAHPTLKLFEESPNDPWVWAMLAGAVIGAPFVEELVYRVFLQGALLKWLKSPWLAIVITALIFAGIHRVGLNPVPWHALIPIFAVGLACGVAYERTRRVGVPIMIHLCFNLLNVILAMLVNAEASQTGV